MKQDIRTHASEMLDQLEETILHFQFHPEDYQKPLDILHGNSIGKHVRHILEFFQCLMEAEICLVVDYDNRKRNLRLEAEPEFGLDTILLLKSAISRAEEKNLRLLVDYGKGKCEAATTFFRELVYNIEHTVHHLAIIKIAVEKHFPHMEIGEHIGVAYSTQQFQKAS